MNYQPLPETFRSDGFDFRLIAREGDVAVFRKRKGERIESWETVIIQKRPAYTFPNGHHTPAHEAMPSSEEWGTAGWTYTSMDRAMAKMRELVSRPVPSRKGAFMPYLRGKEGHSCVTSQTAFAEVKEP